MDTDIMEITIPIAIGIQDIHIILERVSIMDGITLIIIIGHIITLSIIHTITTTIIHIITLITTTPTMDTITGIIHTIITLETIHLDIEDLFLLDLIEIFS